MAPINRRSFLIKGSGVLAVAGAAAVAPSLLTSAAGAETTKATDHEVEPSGPTPTMNDPLVIHVRDLSTGEIGLFSGEQEFTVHDPKLARQLFHSAR